MKSLIEFPEEVVTVTPSSSSSATILQLADKLYATTITFDTDDDIDDGIDSDSDSDQTTTASTITESESESESDIDDSDDDENDNENENENSHYHNRLVEDYDDDATIQDNTNNKQKRSVSFGPIHVRQYERIVGDHPETSVGVPMAIGWAYYEDERHHPNGISIERYESDRIHRKGRNIRMSSITRKNMLLNVFGVPEQELLRAEKDNKKQRRRKLSNKNQPLVVAHTLGKKIRKCGMSFLKGMSYAAQSGMMTGGSSSGFSSSASEQHAFWELEFETIVMYYIATLACISK